MTVDCCLSLRLMAKKKTKVTGAPSQKSPEAETPEEFRTRLHDTRVRYVADLLRELTFLPDVTDDALRREWQLSHGAIEQIVSEARRRVRRELADPDLMLSHGLAALLQVIDRGIAHGDPESVVEAVALWAELCDLRREARAPTD